LRREWIDGCCFIVVSSDFEFTEVFDSPSADNGRRVPASAFPFQKSKAPKLGRGTLHAAAQALATLYDIRRQAQTYFVEKEKLTTMSW
jgi:hypothetical protein